jgi:hypothetical protein
VAWASVPKFPVAWASVRRGALGALGAQFSPAGLSFCARFSPGGLSLRAQFFQGGLSLCAQFPHPLVMGLRARASLDSGLGRGASLIGTFEPNPHIIR